LTLVTVLLAVGLGFTATACAGDQTAKTTAKPRLAKVGNFDNPVEIKPAPGYKDLMFVVEQPGRVMVMRKGKKLKRPFLNIRKRVNHDGERGLLSVAFPPDYRTSKRFYVYYNDDTGDIRVDEYRRKSATVARPSSRRSVIRIAHRENSNHNGGQMHFLGHNLYFGTGDGGGAGDAAGNAQNLRVLLGKLIRIDPRARQGKRYTIPASNPFVGRRDAQAEIFSYGLRNPFRWSFDLVSEREPQIVIADVGESQFEEVNYLPLSRARGGNFGWNEFEGFSEFEGGRSGTIKPSFVLGHDDSYCSVIGGVLVRDRKLPALRGRYIFSDFCKGTVQTFKPETGRIRNIRNTGISGSQISSFGESLSGTLYATSLSGPVFLIKQ
jgi:glucose/arabinose dehydrogenase